MLNFGFSCEVELLKPSTFSIVAYDPLESTGGIAVASKFFAVGSVVPWARAGAGAVATQSYANTSFGPRGLALLESGLSAEEALHTLLADDPQADERQVGIVDARGGSATFTGKSCFEWAGGLTQDSLAIQGNILAGPDVVQAMAAAFVSSTGNLAWRLYKALLAGDHAGGDRRGRQSAALFVVKPHGGYAGYNDRWIDCRVDDHPDPVKRLGELLELQDLYSGKSPEDEQVQLTGASLKTLQDLMLRLGYYKGSLHGEYDKPTQAALRAFIGNENFEERTDFATGTIDRPVLEYLLHHFSVAGEVE